MNINYSCAKTIDKLSSGAHLNSMTARPCLLRVRVISCSCAPHSLATSWPGPASETLVTFTKLSLQPPAAGLGQTGTPIRIIKHKAENKLKTINFRTAGDGTQFL